MNNYSFSINFKSLFLLAILPFLISCGTSTPVKSSAEPYEAQILDEEVRRFDNSAVIHIERMYYNPYIEGFLTAYSNGEKMATDQLTYALTEPEIKRILNPDEVKHFLEQLKTPSQVPLTAYMASRKVILEDLNARGEKNIKNNNRLRNIDKDRMIISSLIFTRDKQFALVDVSKGKLNAMYTTINLYQKEGDKFVFYKTLVGHME